MGKHKQNKEKKLTGPWRNIHGAVWLIGLAILAWKGWWFPGILVLVAISMIVEAAIMAVAPGAYQNETSSNEDEKEDEEQVVSRTAPAPAAAPAAAPVVDEHPYELLPVTCPKCGGPVRGNEVKWSGPRSADCPFCGANLPMRRNE
jgi:hypothetical protein